MTSDSLVPDVHSSRDEGKCAGAVMLFLSDDVLSNTLSSGLAKEGFDVTRHGIAQEALNFLKIHSADILVVDTLVPEMAEQELLRRVTAASPECMPIVLGIREEKEMALKALSSGLAHDFVLKPWDVSTLTRLVVDRVTLKRELLNQELTSLIGGFSALPSSLAGQMALQRMIARGEYSIKDLVREIEKNPALVAKVLHIANSVYYGARKSITELKDALVFIGTEYLISLAAAVDSFQRLHKGRDPYVARQVDRLWSQSLRRATIVRLLVERWPNLKDPQIPYLVSLLQDIGQVLRVCTEPAKFKRWTEICQGREIPYHEAEERVFGIPHARVGALLLQAWNFPDAIVDAVGAHDGVVGDSDLLKILQIGDVIESNDPRTTHDPTMKLLVSAWRDRLHTQILAQHLYRNDPLGGPRP
jgi:HD-like signal output (HDOD) protein